MMYARYVVILVSIIIFTAITYYFALRRRSEQRLDREYCKEKIARYKAGERKTYIMRA